jgi:Phage tail tube protein
VSVQNTHRSYIGIAKETTKGTPVSPSFYIPVTASSLKPVDFIEPLYDEGLRGSLAKNYNYIQGRTRSTFDFSGPVFADAIAYPIAGLLGSDVVTGSSAPYTHTIALKNSATAAADAQPSAFTITDFYGANVRAYSGMQFSDFTLKFSAEGLLEYDAKSMGWISSTASTPTPAFTTVTPTPVWTGTVSVGGTTISNAVDGQLDMKRPVTPIYGIANTQNPYQVFLGATEITGKISFVMEDDTQLTKYLSNTQPALVFNFSQGTGSSATQIQFTTTKGAYTVANISRGKDFVQLDIELNAQANLTDAGAVGYSPIKWVLQNAISSAICA